MEGDGVLPAANLAALAADPMADTSGVAAVSAATALSAREAETLLAECSVDVVVPATDAAFNLTYGETPNESAMDAARQIILAGQRSYALCDETVHFAVLFRLAPHLAHLVHGLIEWIDLSVSASVSEQRARLPREGSMSSKGVAGGYPPVPTITTSMYPGDPTTNVSRNSRSLPPIAAPTVTSNLPSSLSPRSPHPHRPISPIRRDSLGSGLTSVTSLAPGGVGSANTSSSGGVAGPPANQPLSGSTSPQIGTALLYDRPEREDVVFAYTWDPKSKGMWACVNVEEGWAVVQGKVAVVLPPTRLPRPAYVHHLTLSCVASVRQDARETLDASAARLGFAPGWTLDEMANLLEGVGGDPFFPIPPSHPVRLPTANSSATNTSQLPVIPPLLPPHPTRRPASRTLPLIPALSIRATLLPSAVSPDPSRFLVTLETSPGGRWGCKLDGIEVDVDGVRARKMNGPANDEVEGGQVGKKLMRHGDLLCEVYDVVKANGVHGGILGGAVGAVDTTVRVTAWCVPELPGTRRQVVKGRWVWSLSGQGFPRRVEPVQAVGSRQGPEEDDNSAGGGLEVTFVGALSAVVWVWCNALVALADDFYHIQVPVIPTLRRIFRLEVTLVNRTGRVRSLILRVPPAGRTGSGDGSGIKKQQGTSAKSVAEDVPLGVMGEFEFLALWTEKERRDASLVCLENDVQLGHLPANAVRQLSLHFLPLKAGAQSLGPFQLLDEESGEIVWVKDVIGVLVRDK
ncbi:hypothetical protein HDU93_009293 [Gonapodya sp. JEL0774]|nr:hypothetical protein HDU93_009293 [Gonapodya sp. JEL0774]